MRADAVSTCWRAGAAVLPSCRSGSGQEYAMLCDTKNCQKAIDTRMSNSYIPIST